MAPTPRTRHRSLPAWVFAPTTGALCTLAVFATVLPASLLHEGPADALGEWLVGFGLIGAPGGALAIAVHHRADGATSLAWLLVPWLLAGAVFGGAIVLGAQWLGLLAFVLSPFAFQGALRLHDRTLPWTRELLRSLTIVGGAALSIGWLWAILASAAHDVVRAALGGPVEIEEPLIAAAMGLPAWTVLACLADATAGRVLATRDTAATVPDHARA